MDAEALLKLARAGDGGFPDNTEFLPATVGEASLEVDGETRECWVIERTGSGPWPSPGQSAIWIDKTLRIDWLVVEIFKTATDQEVCTSVRKNELRLNPDLSESLFVFTPPTGAREVKGFSNIGGGVH